LIKDNELSSSDALILDKIKPKKYNFPDLLSYLNKIPNGSRVYLGNLDKIAAGTAWEHENTIKIDFNKYVAHGFNKKIFTLDEIIYELATISYQKRFGDDKTPTKDYIETNIYVQQIELFK